LAAHIFSSWLVNNMNRFSLRTQVFLLVGAFVAMLAAIAATSWFVNARLTDSIYHSREVVAQLKSLDDIKEDIEQGLADLLAYTGGEAEGLERFRGNIEEVATEIAKAETLFLKGTIENARDQGVFDTVTGLTPTVVGFDVMTEQLEQAAVEDRREMAYTVIMPAIAHLRGTIDGMQDAVGGKKQIVEDQISAQILRSQTIQLAATAIAMVSALVMALIFGNLLSRPVVDAARAVNRLVGEDYDSAIDGTERGDEVGEISRNLASLRDRLSEAQSAEAKNQEENSRRIELFHTLSEAMSRLKGGDLQGRIQSSDWSDLGENYELLCLDFNDLASALCDLVDQLRVSSGAVQQNAGALSNMSDEMSQRAETQAATLEESAAALDELSAGVRSASEQAQAAAQQATDGRDEAEQGGEVMQQAMQAMAAIAESSERISKVISVIDDIAFQTSLLALNAGVEAARAGEAGRGFAVVASEVRNLALLAARSASEIKDLVNNSTKHVADGEHLVRATSDTLERIVANVASVSEIVNSIASSASEQASGVAEISIGVSQLDQVTQQNVAMVHDTSAASQRMSEEATRLTELLQRFAGDDQSAQLEDEATAA
jgi:methyl-accepting chemotaxis protein